MAEQFEQNEFMFHMVFTNNFISRTDIFDPLKTDSYFLNGPEGIMIEYVDDDTINNSLFLSYNTANVVNQ
jgi:hypothetical protein